MEKAKDDVAEALEKMRKEYTGNKFQRLADELAQSLDRFLDAFFEAVEDLETEVMDEQEDFDFRRSRLLGQSEEMFSLARKSPERPCKEFKARQVNQVLLPLKDELEEFLGEPLSLVAEDGSMSYSDVSMLIRNYLDLSAFYGRQHYKLNYYEKRKKA